MLKHYVRFFIPGSFFPESTTQEVRERTPEAAKPWPDCAFAFQFFSQEQMEGESGVLVGPETDKSGRYYIDARKMTAEEIEKEVPESRMLVANMRGNGWQYVVKCRTGNFQPLEDRDRIVYSDENAER